MAIVKKISELTPKGSPLANTDLLIVGVDNGTDYDLKSVTGAQVLGNVVSQTITDGVTTKSPSENVLFDALALKVDKVAGSRLITSAEATILGNTSGTNTGDQNLQSVTNLGATTSNAISTQNATFQSSLAPSQIQTQRLSNSKRSSLNADGFIAFSTTGTAEATLKATNILNDVTLEVPNKSVGSYTIATTSDFSGTNTGDQDLSGLMVKSNNLSDLTNTTTARSNLGLGSLATQSGTFSGTSSGTNTGDQIISDATITTSDITTNDVSITKHGFAPKAPNNTTTFLRGDGTWATPAAGGLTQFVEAETTAAPNATVPVDSLSASGTATNIDVAIRPKGTGAFIAAIPDSTATGGNKRGASAVDLCLVRNGANKVAGGVASGLFAGQNNFIDLGQTNCTIIGGNGANLYGGTNSAMLSCVGGELNGSNTVMVGAVSSFGFGANCLVTGSSNTASGTSNTLTGTGHAGGGTNNLLSGNSNSSTGTSCLLSGTSNVSTGKRNLLLGQWGNDFGHSSRLVIGSFQDIGPYTKGISQLSTLVTTFVSTTNTAVELVNFDSTAIALILQDNNAMRIKGSIIGKQTASTNVACYDFDCVIVRGANASSTTLPLSNMTLVLDTITLGTVPTLTANTTLGGLSIKSGAKTTTTIRWVARIDSTESILA